MEEILSIFDFNGINPEYVDDVKIMCRTFQHVEFVPNTDVATTTAVRINGDLIHHDKYNFIITNTKQGINVQAMKKGTDYFRFGVMINNRATEVLDIWPYMNGHIH